MDVKYQIIHETSRGEIKIINHPLYGKIAICSCVLGLDLCKKFAKKHGARLPSIAEYNSLNWRRPTLSELTFLTNPKTVKR